MKARRDTATPETSFRIRPEDWLNPLPLHNLFEQPDRPLELDVGCGKGRFLLAHAQGNPGVNFLGIDRMLRRIRALDRKVRRREIRNVRLLRMEAYYATTYLVPPDSVTTYYIFFPDPWPKKRHRDHRLFNPKFMDALHRTMRAGGRMHFATDHLPYYEAVCELFRADGRFKEVAPYVPAEEERTDFELWYIREGSIGRLSVEKQD
jgi:tRNA (guanine-N7-)-methyltransferase